ncbi:MAG TPA: gluconokinase [Chthonomonas sp.]|uniref:gluconokinase n=1 Tax=Chthonomonas sp. TaxID=2282153 RepID=UPI002B4B15D0|nr:gluconokinase [Chthonomonas sp.]HLI48028.1 gluconokinase [Chthonomonas sp.]
MCPPTGDSDPLALSIDVGTSSTRVMLWDLQGHAVQNAHAQVAYRMHTTPEGGVEIDMEELATHVEHCLDTALANAGEMAKQVAVVGVSTFWHSCLGVDAKGRPVTPLYNWADMRAAAAAQRLRERLDAEAIHRRTGCPLHPSYYPARLAWLRESCPDTFSKVTQWLSPGEFLYRRWFGRADVPISVSMASATGLFNQKRCIWDEELLSHLGLSAKHLAPIATEGERLEGLQSAYASRWPALANKPFCLPYGDGACSNVGSGCLESTHMAINLGTSGAIRVLWDIRREAFDPDPPAGLWRYRVDGYRPLIGAAFSDGGLVYDWMQRTLRLPENAENLLAGREPGDHGLLFLPFLAGERSFGWSLSARASLMGLQLDTTPLDILAAGMEAVAMQFAEAVERLKPLFPKANRIVASGGALGHSPLWAQMMADAIGHPIVLSKEAEASSRGAALLALETVGFIPDLRRVTADQQKTYRPRVAHHQAFMHLRQRFKEALA